MSAPRIIRPAATATWEQEHRWGTLLGDTTTLRVSRTANGHMVVSYDKDRVEIHPSLIEAFAEMVAAAAVWTDGGAS